MESLPSQTARQELVHNLVTLQSLYAQKAQTLMQVAAQMDAIGIPPTEETSLTPEQARSQASYAALCANFAGTAARRINAGECDPELLELIREFTAEEAVVGNPVEPAGS